MFDFIMQLFIAVIPTYFPNWISRIFSIYKLYVPLREAAIEGCNEIANTELDNFIRNNLNLREEEMLNYIGQMIWNNAPLYAHRPPSTKWEQVDLSLSNKCVIDNGAQQIRFYKETNPKYINVSIKKKDKNKAIKKLRSEAKNFS